MNEGMKECNDTSLRDEEREREREYVCTGVYDE
jgi:hypothetical protein